MTSRFIVEYSSHLYIYIVTRSEQLTPTLEQDGFYLGHLGQYLKASPALLCILHHALPLEARLGGRVAPIVKYPRPCRPRVETYSRGAERAVPGGGGRLAGGKWHRAPCITPGPGGVGPGRAVVRLLHHTRH